MTDIGDRLPPFNLEAEQRVLGSMLLDNSTIDEVMAVVAEEDFFRDTHQLIFRAIIALSRRSTPIMPLTLVEALQRRGQLLRAGGEEAIAEILHVTPHAADAVYLAEIVRQKACSRRVLEEALQTMKDVYSDLFTADELVEGLERRAFALADRRGRIVAEPIEDLVAEEMRLFDERTIGGGGGGLLTGINPIDSMLGGLRPRLYILAARPGEGKSSLALNIADNVASTGEPSLFFSLEMDDSELAQRFLASRAGINSKKISDPKFAMDEDRAKLDRAVSGIAGTPLSIVDTPAITTAQIASACRRHKSRQGLSLAIVDYVQHILPENRRESRQEQMAGVSRDLMRLAKELDCPILALAQLNREVEKREDRRPRMSDLRESGQFEADAHGIMLLSRNPEKPGTAELIVAKNRGGATGAIELRFDPQTTTFSAIEPEHRYF